MQSREEKQMKPVGFQSQKKDTCIKDFVVDATSDVDCEL